MEWNRRRKVFEEAFAILESIERYPDALFVYGPTTEGCIGADRMLAEVSAWLDRFGPRTVRFSGESGDFREITGEPTLDEATRAMLLGQAAREGP